MKEHLLVKGMKFIGNQLIEVKLIPDPEYVVEETNSEIDYNNPQTVVESVNKILIQKQELERTIYLGVDEWNTNNYNFGRKIILDINPGEIKNEESNK